MILAASDYQLAFVRDACFDVSDRPLYCFSPIWHFIVSKTIRKNTTHGSKQRLDKIAAMALKLSTLFGKQLLTVCIGLLFFRYSILLILDHRVSCFIKVFPETLIVSDSAGMAGSNSSGDSRVIIESYNNDPLHLHPFDHPTMLITNLKFTGSSFPK